MIEINNLTTISVDKDFFKKTAQKVLKNESALPFTLSIVLVGSARIKKLNKKYRKKNQVTDVLAFGQGPVFISADAEALADKKVSAGRQKFPSLPEREQELGEIVICPQEVKKNAQRFNSAFKKELVRVLIHGILHLLGYDHEKGKKEAEKMSEKEEYYLSDY